MKKTSQMMKTMINRQNYHIYRSRCAKVCLKSGAQHCTVCINVPQIQDILMHGVHKRASDSGHTYAWGA